MKEQSDQVIIYDDACPMCTAYTATFVHLGWLSNRIPFSQIPKNILQRINVDRGRHEIPLYNRQNGQTVYGLDALFLIIGNRFPKLNPIFRNRLFRFFWKQIYWLITYNRRIIAGSGAPASGIDCAPDLHLGYRWSYIFLMIALTSFMILPFSFLYLAMPILFWGLTGIMSLGLLFGLLSKTDRLSWLGHWVTILFIVVLGMNLLPVSKITLFGLVLLCSYLLWKRWKLTLLTH